MDGINDSPRALGDWPPADPSPKAFTPNLQKEDLSLSTFLGALPENGSVGTLHDEQTPEAVLSLGQKDGILGIDISTDPFFKPDSPNAVMKPGNRGGLAKRMAARTGFSAPMLNTAGINSVNTSSSSSEIRSPYLTIPPGLSPTTLLDSPVFLSNSLAQPSPTTGKFWLEQLSSTISSVPESTAFDKTKVHSFADDGVQSFVFKPSMASNSSYSNSTKRVTTTMELPHSLPTIEVLVRPEALKHESEDTVDVKLQNPQKHNMNFSFSKLPDQRDAAGDLTFNQNVSDSIMGDEQSPLFDGQQDGEGENKGEYSSAAVGAPSEDGYNWRKYGQKQVKGSEFPRSYYKCTHPNCPVKKKVERSHEGHITEIIYKGAHNHSKPPPTRRAPFPPSQASDLLINGSEAHASQTVVDGKSSWASALGGNSVPDLENEGLEVTSAVAAEFGDTTSIQVQDRCHIESDPAIGVSSTLSNEDENDQATHGSITLSRDDEDDESESKRRKLDNTAVEMSAASRAVREPRVVVQTTSEVDILDDGYRWRKYGQKVVKGNPNPRSYYKCTNQGCTVRKHVERASHDLKSVITTYEGKHNHEVPAARSSSHATSGPSNSATTSALQSQGAHRAAPECPQESLPRFDMVLPLGAYAMSAREQHGAPAPFPSPMAQQGFANLAMAGLGPPARMKMHPPVQSFPRPPHMGEACFMVPKGESKENAAPNGAAAYHQMMSRLPLGPQM